MDELIKTFEVARWIPVKFVLATLLIIICLTVLYFIVRKAIDHLFK